MIKPMYLQSKGMSPFFLDTYKGMLYSYIILILYEINKLVQNKMGELKMERITSFSVDHQKLTKGVYVSRIDGDLITYDIRMTQPNVEPALKPEAAHTIEHIGATLLRNGKYKDQVIYFGPMGCMTGFYLIVRDLDLEVIKEVVKDVYSQISSWDQEIPGAKEEECGNYTFMDLAEAKKAANYFVNSKWEHEYHLL